MIGLRVARIGAASVVLVAVAAAHAGAQGPQTSLDSLRAKYMLALPKTIEVAASALRSSPGSSAGSPSAYGANWGDGFAGVGFQLRTRYHSSSLPFRQRADGSIVVGFGLGNSRDNIGVETAITSFGTVRSGIGNHNGISFKLHRVLPKNIGVAAGWENAIITDGTDGGQSIYGAMSTVLKSADPGAIVFKTMTLTGGVGAGRFRRERDVLADKKTVQGFASMGLRVIDPVSFIADFTGQDLTLALSIVPFVRIPLIFTPGFADVTGSAGDGARFTMGVGMGFRFAQIRDIFAPNH